MTNHSTMTCDCDDCKAAMKSGTDGEGYGALLWWLDDEWIMGHNLPPVIYCPWCGNLITPGDPG